MARFSDRGEGKSSEFVTGPDFWRGDVVVQGETIAEGVEFYGCSAHVILTEEFNDHVFCVSEGAYDREHHKKMLFGERLDDGSEYLGNSDITAYAEIDLEKFMQGLRFWLANEQLVSSPLAIFEIVRAYNVQYQDRDLNTQIISGDITGNVGSIKSRFEAMIKKPPAFRTEKEVRLWVGIKYPEGLERGAPPLFPKSSRLKRSIVSMGHYERE